MNAEKKYDELPRGEPTPTEFAEAAAWVARLHGPNRTVQAEAGFRRWLSASASRASAFEAMTAAWEITAKLPPAPFPRLSRWQRAGYRDGFIRSGLVMAGVATIIVGAILYLNKAAGVATGIGEQRLLALEDGSKILLNTATRVVVKYDRNIRRVELKNGEALFDVAKAPDRPFVVEAGGRQVRALGTSFVVREEGARMSVTLVEGKVSVTPLAAPLSSAGQGRGEGTSLSSPGERLTFSAHQAPKLDRPQVEKVMAWRRGQLDFENTPLAAAVNEMNRYSVEKIRVTEAQAQAIPITGVFRAGDAPSFAAAVARAYALKMSQESGEIRLSGAAATSAKP